MKDESEFTKKTVKTIDTGKVVLIQCQECGMYIDPDTMYCDVCDIDYYER